MRSTTEAFEGDRDETEEKQMPEQMEAGQQQQQQQPLQDVGPLLVSVVAAAAAGALAVLARKAMSGGGGGDGAQSSSGEGEGETDQGGTSFDDVDKVADDLQGLVEQLRSEAGGGRDSRRLTEIMDTIGEYADQAADAFSAGDSGEGEDGEDSGRRVTDELMSRISELTGSEEKAGSDSSAKSTQKAR